MIYKFRIVSDEVDNFKREICIDSDASFLELHDAILDSVGFSKDQMTSFFICDDDWEKKTEITLMDMGKDSDEDTWIMASTKLRRRPTISFCIRLHDRPHVFYGIERDRTGKRFRDPGLHT